MQTVAHEINNFSKLYNFVEKVNNEGYLTSNLMKEGYTSNILQQIPYFVKNETNYKSFCQTENMDLDFDKYVVCSEAILDKLKSSFKIIKDKLFSKTTKEQDILNSLQSDITEQSDVKINDNELSQQKVKKGPSYKTIAIWVGTILAISLVAWYCIENWDSIIKGKQNIINTIKTKWDSVRFPFGKKPVTVTGTKLNVNESELKEVKHSMKEEFTDKNKKELGWTRRTLLFIYGKLKEIVNKLATAPKVIMDLLSKFFKLFDKNKPIENSTNSNISRNVIPLTTFGNYNERIGDLIRSSDINYAKSLTSEIIQEYKNDKSYGVIVNRLSDALVKVGETVFNLKDISKLKDIESCLDKLAISTNDSDIVTDQRKVNIMINNLQKGTTESFVTCEINDVDTTISNTGMLKQVWRLLSFIKNLFSLMTNMVLSSLSMLRLIKIGNA